MPKKSEEMMYILSPSRAYLAPLHLMGPIVHPIKTSKSSVVQLLLAGTEVHEYYPKTKRTLQLTLTNINNPDRYNQYFHESTIPVETPVIPQQQKVIIDESKNIINPVNNTNNDNDNQDNQEYTEIEIPKETPTTETPSININFTLKEDGTVDESAINWASMTKNQRREVRKQINNINEKVTNTK